MTAAVAAGDGAALLASPVRRGIVDTLAAHERHSGRGATGDPPGLTAAQLGERLGVHVTTARFHLDQLVAAGIVRAGFRRHSGAGRPRKVYAVAPGSLDDAVTRESLALLTGLLAETFGGIADGRPVTPVEAGERWAREHVPADPESAPADTPGTWLAKVGRMIDVLQDWGYTPDLSTSRGGRTASIDLARCPFLDLARANTAVVCGIHRGLITGAMEQFGETDADISLEPFIEPELCRAHVTTNTTFRSPSRTKESSG